MTSLTALAPLLKNKTIFITGGTGFFGKNLCSTLSRMNAEFKLDLKILALARNSVSIPDVKVITQDVTSPFEFNIPVDYLIHAATPVVSAAGDYDSQLNTIINGTQNALNFALKNNVTKFLLVSSGAVYGEQPDDIENIPEDYKVHGPVWDLKNIYGTGKRMSELLALNYLNQSKIDLTIARCFAFSGIHLPLDQHLAIGNFVKDALEHKKINIKSDGTALRTYMDADDLSLWLLTILLKGKNQEAYNVGSESVVSIKELAYTIKELIPGTEVTIENSNINLKRNRYIPLTFKARDQLNLNINISLRESLQKMIDFNRN